MKVWLLILTLALSLTGGLAAPAWAVSPAKLAPSPARLAAHQALEQGWRYFDRGDMAAALRHFKQAALGDPGLAQAYFGQAFVYSRQKRWDLAEANYLQTMKLAPNFPHAYGNLAMIYWSQGNLAQAGLLMRRALELAPGDPMVRQNAAYYFFSVGDYNAAWRHLKRAQKLGARLDPAFVQDLRARAPQP